MTSLIKWPIVKLNELASDEKYAIVGGPFGSNLVSADYVDSGVPVVRGINLSKERRFTCENFVFVTETKADSLKSNLAKAGDLVFTQRGTLGQVGIIPSGTNYDRFVISQSQMKMTVNNKKANPIYLYNYFRLKSTVSYIENHALQSGVPHINLGILKNLEVICPPVIVQNKISSILSGYDDLIENNKRRIRLLEKMVEEIYREWFVRFRFPDYKTVGIKKGVPNGWEAVRIEKLIKRIQVGMRYEKKTVDEYGNVPVFDQGQSGIIGYHNKDPGVFASKNDPVIVFANHTCYQRMIFIPFSTIQNVLPFKVSSEYPSSIYWLHYATHKIISFSEYKGHWPEFISKQIFYPGEALTLKFEEMVKPMLIEIEVFEAVIKNLKSTRDYLVPRLISGKLSVEDLDIQFPQSMQEESAA